MTDPETVLSSARDCLTDAMYMVVDGPDVRRAMLDRLNANLSALAALRADGANALVKQRAANLEGELGLAVARVRWLDRGLDMTLFLPSAARALVPSLRPRLAVS